jgi:molybdate/tungstate transport system substrate-binding protein
MDGARFPRPRTVAYALVAGVLLVLLLSDCSSTTTTTASAKGTGPVDVLYAGSLVTMMENAMGPAFEGATGYTYSGFSAGSDALASDIKGKTQVGDVFISASPKVNASLAGSANGSWVSWYAAFGTSPLVIGYNPNSSFATQLQTKPWYDVVTQPGFLLGRTDPATDPKGALAVQALNQTAAAEHLPALSQLATSTSGEYPEQTLVGLLQSGQLDAGFFYATEAKAAGIPTVSLGSIHLNAVYTITVLNRAPHAAAGEAFVTFALGPEGRSIMKHDGLTLITPPSVTGSSNVPASLRTTLHVS